MSKSSRPSLTQLVRHELPSREMPVVSPLLEAAVLPAAEPQRAASAPSVPYDSQQLSVQPSAVQLASEQASAASAVSDYPVQPRVQPASVQMPEHPLGPGTKLVPRSGPRRGDPTQSATYRLPLPLYNQLVDVAHHYRIAMTDIVVEALEQHLKNFPLPR